jgi:hypothetical protein
MISKTGESGLVAMRVRMPPEMKARLIRMAAAKGVSLNDLLIAAFEKRLDARDAERAALAKKEGQS